MKKWAVGGLWKAKNCSMGAPLREWYRDDKDDGGNIIAPYYFPAGSSDAVNIREAQSHCSKLSSDPITSMHW